jgi:hypothetical protein
MVYLITEIAATPHHGEFFLQLLTIIPILILFSVRQGCNAPKFGKAYQIIVQDLVSFSVMHKPKICSPTLFL